MRVVLKSPPPVQLPPLPIRVELARDMPAAERAALAERMSATISTELRFRAEVELVDPGSLSAFQQDKNQKQQIFDREYEA